MNSKVNSQGKGVTWGPQAPQYSFRHSMATGFQRRSFGQFGSFKGKGLGFRTSKGWSHSRFPYGKGRGRLGLRGMLPLPKAGTRGTLFPQGEETSTVVEGTGRATIAAADPGRGNPSTSGITTGFDSKLQTAGIRGPSFCPRNTGRIQQSGGNQEGDRGGWPHKVFGALVCSSEKGGLQNKVKTDHRLQKNKSILLHTTFQVGSPGEHFFLFCKNACLQPKWI